MKTSCGTTTGQGKTNIKGVRDSRFLMAKRYLISPTRVAALLLYIFVPCLGFILISGCGEGQQNGTESPESPHEEAAEPEASPAEEPEPVDTVELQPVDAVKYHKILEKHRGDIVVVDFWATWCPPCVASFPELVRLHSDYSDKGVTVIAVSADFPGEEDSVGDFLKEQEAYFTNLIIRAKNTDEFISEVSEAWGGDLPAVFLYNRSGELIAEHVGSGVVEKVEGKIREMLNENES